LSRQLGDILVVGSIDIFASCEQLDGAFRLRFVGEKNVCVGLEDDAICTRSDRVITTAIMKHNDENLHVPVRIFCRILTNFMSFCL
jgi:hypothetical protein